MHSLKFMESVKVLAHTERNPTCNPWRIKILRAAKFAGGFVERRRVVRFRLNAPAIFRWKDQSGTKQEEMGRTLDISTSGIFVTCQTALPVGAAVSLEIHVPPLERNTLQQLRLEATGRIVRLVEAGPNSGFAATAQLSLHDI